MAEVRETEGESSLRPLRRLANGWVWLAVVGLLAMVPALAVVASGRTVVWRDTATLFGPVRPLVADALRSFRLPLWNPYEGFGLPLLGQMIHGVLHPISLVAAWVDPSGATEAMAVAYLGVAAVGAAVLARTLGCSRAAAAAAGLAFGMSGYVQGMTAILQYLAAAASAPWAVAGVRAAAAGGSASLVAGSAAVLVLHLAGDPQWTLVAAALGLALAASAEGGRGLARAVLPVVLGTGLAAVQLVPSWAYLSESLRGSGITGPDRLQWALAPARLLELFAPGLFAGRPGVENPAPVFAWLGGPTQSLLTIPFLPSVHLGAAAVALALAGLRAGRDAKVLGAACAAVLWLALGPNLGATQATAWIPVWGAFRYSEKLVGPLSLCVAMLAGLGVDRLAGLTSRSWPRGLAVAGVASLLAYFAMAAFPAPAGAFRVEPATLERAWSAVSRGFVLSGVALAALGGLCATAARLGRPRFSLLAAGLVLAQSAAAMPFTLRVGTRGLEAGPVVLRDPDPLVTRVATPLETPPRSNPLRLDSGDLEVAVKSRMGVAALNVRARVDQVSPYTGLLPRNLRAIGEAFGPDLWVALRRYGVTHVVLKEPADRFEGEVAAVAVHGGAPSVADPSWGITAWRVPHRPWAFFAERVSSAPSFEAALEAVRAADLAGLPGVVAVGAAPSAAASGRLLRVHRQAERVEVEAESQGDGFLVLSDAFWPGWTATVDGRPAEVLRTDALVRGVAWPAGRHVLVMEYDPPEARWGSIVSGSSMLVVAALAFTRRRSSRGAPGHPPSAGSPSRDFSA
jgi:hypothetical protein